MRTTAQFFKALSEEPRLRILALLLNGELGVWMYYRLAEMETPLAGELVELLNKSLIELPDTQQDYATLEKFRRNSNKCA
ncbi:MAG: hypothetical protein ACYC2W_01755 [Desulfurivibrionaceae bacterium]